MNIRKERQEAKKHSRDREMSELLPFAPTIKGWDGHPDRLDPDAHVARLQAAKARHDDWVRHEQGRQVDEELRYLAEHSVHREPAGCADLEAAIQRLYRDAGRRQRRLEEERLRMAEAQRRELEESSVHRGRAPAPPTDVGHLVRRLYAEDRRLREVRAGARRRMRELWHGGRCPRVELRGTRADGPCPVRLEMLHFDARRRAAELERRRHDDLRAELEGQRLRSVHAAAQQRRQWTEGDLQRVGVELHRGLRRRARRRAREEGRGPQAARGRARTGSARRSERPARPASAGRVLSRAGSQPDLRQEASTASESESSAASRALTAPLPASSRTSSVESRSPAQDPLARSTDTSQSSSQSPRHATASQVPGQGHAGTPRGVHPGFHDGGGREGSGPESVGRRSVATAGRAASERRPGRRLSLSPGPRLQRAQPHLPTRADAQAPDRPLGKTRGAETGGGGCPEAEEAAVASGCPEEATGSAGVPSHSARPSRSPRPSAAAPRGSSLVPPAAWGERQPAGGLEGYWTHRQRPGSRTEAIRGDTIIWHDGVETRIVAEGRGLYSAELAGVTYRARLLGDQLLWDDGDTWIFVQALPKGGWLPPRRRASPRTPRRHAHDQPKSTFGMGHRLVLTSRDSEGVPGPGAYGLPRSRSADRTPRRSPSSRG